MKKNKIFHGMLFSASRHGRPTSVNVVATSKKIAAEHLSNHDFFTTVGEVNKYMSESRNPQAQKFVDENPDAVVFIEVREFSHEYEKVERKSLT